MILKKINFVGLGIKWIRETSQQNIKNIWGGGGGGWGGRKHKNSDSQISISIFSRIVDRI